MLCSCELIVKGVQVGNNVSYVNNKMKCCFLLNFVNVMLILDVFGQSFCLCVFVVVFCFVEYCGGFDVFFVKVNENEFSMCVCLLKCQIVKKFVEVV